MNKQKLLALCLSLGISFSTLTGCAAVNQHQNLNEKRDAIAETMSQDANVDFFNVRNITLFKDDNGYFVNFKGHYDTKFTPGWHGGSYEDHKDYSITYKVSSSTYGELYKNNNNRNFSTLISLKEDALNSIQEVVNNYDVYTVEEIENENELCR